ncbi:SDR family oxidoreductase [Gordonia jinhuaensis]|uniref:Short chain dehydrogenase/reductase n=1 Tax=Gordonia jinhuaensis TaxID=1517702 RepID=A0A916WRZ1_9ACTN|nr:SDR family oxidoreductase [Gordonia jinhuaensis]GGB27123.1 putative short chain dehydrogenase/reductase [Gordonia jinhuaensis]
MEMQGKVIIVTGAGGGIGGALARAFTAAGGKVVLTDLDAAAVTETARAIEADGGAVAVTSGDASSNEHIDAVVALAEREFGPVDMYVANAGIGGAAGLAATDADWEHAIDVNLMAHVRAARRLVPQWVQRGSGYFLSTASAAGLLTQIGSATYSVTKHAVIGFDEWLSVTYGDSGVAVSCLCPMGVDTKLLRPDGIDGDDAEKLMQNAVETAGDVLTPAAVADAVMEGIADERFLILPHPEVLKMYRYKGSDYDRWLGGMRRYQASLMAPTGS